jgi:hypothetical protein
MSFAKKAITLVIGLTMIGGTIGAAAASTPWQRNHPWRLQVNHRLATQNRRINAELRRDEITPWRARALHREDRAIRHEERVMAGLNHSHLTPAEHRALNQQENAVSRQIGR